MTLAVAQQPTLRRVTGVIDEAGLGFDFSRIPDSVMGPAIARGNLVHEAVELVDHGDLDERTVPARIRPYVDAYRQFVADVSYRPIAAEHEVTHPFGYAGRIDKVGWVRAARWLPDVKSAVSLALGPVMLQVAAYVQAWNVTYPTEPITAAGSLQLLPTGKYKWKRLELERAWFVFVAALHLLQRTATRAELDALDAWVRDYPTGG